MDLKAGGLSGEGPRERLFREGPEALSTVELIAVLLRTGARGRSALRIAEELLRHFGSLETLARAGDSQIRGSAGIGPAKLAGLRAAFELGEHVRSLTFKLEGATREPRQKISLSFVGSLLTEGTLLAKIAKHKIEFSIPQITVIRPQAPPAFGAVLMALHLAKD